MTVWKLGIVAVIMGVIGLFAYDGVQVLDARRNISDTASAAAAAAAHTISTNKQCAGANAPVAATSSSTTKCANPRDAATRLAKGQGDVVTSFIYDPVAARVSVTVSGSANSLVLHYLDRNLTDNIHASSSARPQ